MSFEQIRQHIADHATILGSITGRFDALDKKMGAIDTRLEPMLAKAETQIKFLYENSEDIKRRVQKEFDGMGASVREQETRHTELIRHAKAQFESRSKVFVSSKHHTWRDG